MKKNPTKIALVTGAARGIGRAIASEFLAATEGPEKAIRRCIEVNGGHFMPEGVALMLPLLQVFYASSKVSHPNAIVSRFQINVGATHAIVIYPKP